LTQAGVMNTEIFDKYIDNIRKEYSTGVAREHAYRPALKNLFEALEPGTIAINDPARQEVGAPDFQIEDGADHQLRQAKILSSPPLAFVEHKDITENLDKPEHQSQLKRYLRLGNVLHTNGLIFRFYIKDEKPIEIILAELTPAKTIVVDSAQYNQLALAYHQLIVTTALTVRTPLKLATLMAERAQAIRDIIEAALTKDLQEQKNTELTNQFKVFKTQLVHDLDEHKFGDLYAQTLAYGLFAARYSDKSLNNFSLGEAARLMPPTNRFLRKFFQEIAGYESESRINWVLDNLVEVFNHVDVRQLMYGAGEEWAKHHDPIIHFYETFLGLYDPKLRKNMGVYYTPQPVVRYIVRQVDRMLKEKFEIDGGLADHTKVDREFKSQPVTFADKKRGYATGKKIVHKVQVLDPALGTGTFLNEVIRNISSQVKPKLGSSWSKYIELDLLPRLYGFELMMAPYAMANLRLNLTLAETGYRIISPDARLHVLLTNSLEAPNENELNQLPFAGFQQILATEAQEADVIKSNHNVMVVMGNPPYSVSSNNKSEYIQKLIKDYKKDLNEKKTNLDDDYIKFIRFAEEMVDKNGEGIVAMITNNSYVDGITHRQMRKHLLQTFDDIFILNLHGSSKKNETSPDGTQDENVFDIMQGVAIIIAIKSSATNKETLGNLYYAELYGKRQDKFSKLDSVNPGSLEWQKLDLAAPNYFFVPKDFALLENYSTFISLHDLFTVVGSGIKNERDAICLDFTKQDLEKRITDFVNLPVDELKSRYQVSDSRDWKVSNAKEDIMQHQNEDLYYRTFYRPFDSRWTYYTGKSRGFIGTPNLRGMKHMKQKNLLLVFTRLNRQISLNYFFCSDSFVDIHLLDSAGDSLNTAPLYLYHDDGSKTTNFDSKTLKDLTEHMQGSYEPEDIFDYVYGVINTPGYQARYREFLKIGFPGIPIPKNDEVFKNFAETGAQLRSVHLLADPDLDESHFTPTGEGEWVVQKVSFREAEDNEVNVYINDNQYFANVPKVAWDFYIGGYQPARKWLKDRKGKELTHQDIGHYQKIVAALKKTSELRKHLDEIWELR